jgi:hypothetical protein
VTANGINDFVSLAIRSDLSVSVVGVGSLSSLLSTPQPGDGPIGKHDYSVTATIIKTRLHVEQTI